ncbi:hypothetical protein D9M68_995040 [compost metagenome]
MSPGLISSPRRPDLNGCDSDQAEDQVDVSDSPTTHWSALMEVVTSCSMPDSAPVSVNSVRPSMKMASRPGFSEE